MLIILFMEVKYRTIKKSNGGGARHLMMMPVPEE
jgi:hypothetical protein